MLCNSFVSKRSVLACKKKLFIKGNKYIRDYIFEKLELCDPNPRLISLRSSPTLQDAKYKYK